MFYFLVDFCLQFKLKMIPTLNIRIPETRTLPPHCQWFRTLLFCCRDLKEMPVVCTQFSWTRESFAFSCVSLAVDTKLPTLVLPSLGLFGLLLMRPIRNGNWPQINTWLFLQSHPSILKHWSVKSQEFFVSQWCELTSHIITVEALLANLIYVMGPLPSARVGFLVLCLRQE